MSEHPWSLQREARLRAREQVLDPHGRLSAEERRRRALEEDARYFHELGKRSGEVRRERAARLAALEAAAIERAARESLAS